MKIYIAGPMRGIPDFNFPLFYSVSEFLRSHGHIVFNPAERDNKQHGELKSETGDLKDIAHLGFSLRDALAADTEWICHHAEAIALLPGWEKSSGARAEKALAEALGLEIFFIASDNNEHYGLFQNE